MLETIAQVFAELHFQYTEQFLAALLPMSLTVVIHGQGLGLAARYFRRFAPAAHGRTRAGSRTAVLVTIVAIMLLTHFIEVSGWAVFYFLTGMLQDFREAMSYSVNAYTTLGASNIDLPGRWKGLGGFEAMTAMLMFGWSTAVLAAVVQKTHSIDG